MKRFSDSANRSDRIAYIAGIIDGEGCLYVKHGKYPTLEIEVTCRELVEVIQELYPGRINSRNRAHGRKAIHRISFNRPELLSEILTDTIGLLIEKRKQAELVLELLGLERGPKTELRLAQIDQELRRLKR